jgi:hypothetical protein
MSLQLTKPITPKPPPSLTRPDKTETARENRRLIRDTFTPAKVSAVSSAATGNPPNKVARFDHYPSKPGMATGKITINGHTYTFRSGTDPKNTKGGKGLLSTPKGQFLVKGTSPIVKPAMTLNGVSFNHNLLNPKTGAEGTNDPRRPNQPRTELRIHPDGNVPGTAGCIGIVGTKAQLEAFEKDMKAEQARSPKGFILTVQ